MNQQLKRYKSKERTRILSLLVGIVSSAIILYMYLGHLSSKSPRMPVQGVKVRMMKSNF